MSDKKRGRNVTYAVQEEPAFIRQFKERIGYKEEPGIEAKAATESSKVDCLQDENLDSDGVDEKPVVVVLRPGDLTAEEAEEQGLELSTAEASVKFNPNRMVFRKPTKRASDGKDDILPVNSASTSGSKKLKTSSISSEKRRTSSEQLEHKNNRIEESLGSSSSSGSSATGKKQADLNLLSFDEDDD